MKQCKLPNENNIITLKDGRKFGYATYGDLKGKPLFFFHGWPSSRLQAKIIDTTAQKLHIRVISPDRPGYGLSTYKKDRKLLDLASDITELANDLHIKTFAIMGVSGGAPYAVACAYAIPERITNVGIVVGLASTNIAGALQGMAPVNQLAWWSYTVSPFFMHWVSFLNLLQAKINLPDTIFSYRAKEDNKVIKENNLQGDIQRNRAEAFRQGKQAAVMDLKLYTNDWGFDLKEIKANVFLWYGDADKQVSVVMGKYYAAQIPNSKLTIYPNEGHMLLKNHTEEILKALTD